MAETSTNTAPELTGTESTPITNGAPTVNDVEMADSKPAQEVLTHLLSFGEVSLNWHSR